MISLWPLAELIDLTTSNEETATDLVSPGGLRTIIPLLFKMTAFTFHPQR